MQNRTRYRMTNPERSTLAGRQIGEWLDSQPVGLAVAYRLFAQRTLDFADDAHSRTGTKTWAGFSERDDPKRQLCRLKSVEATVGTMVACAARGEPRSTTSWVLDAVEYAMGILRGTRIVATREENNDV